MLVDGGGLQRKTVTSILMAWVLLPGGGFCCRRAVLDSAEDYLRS